MFCSFGDSCSVRLVISQPRKKHAPSLRERGFVDFAAKIFVLPAGWERPSNDSHTNHNMGDDHKQTKTGFRKNQKALLTVKLHWSSKAAELSTVLHEM